MTILKGICALRRPGFSTFDAIGVLVIAIWIVAMVQLLASNRTPTAENVLEISPEEAVAGFRAGEEWRGLYHGRDKVGFIRIQKTVLEDGFEIELWQVLRLSMMGREQRLDVRVRTEADADFVLREFDGELEAQGSRFEIRGTVEPPASGSAGDTDGYVVRFELITQGSEFSDEIVLTTPPLIEQDLSRALLANDPIPGDTFETSFFDPMSQSERPVILEYEGTDDVQVMGADIQAHRLVQHVGGRTLTLWVNDLGEVLREELPLGLTGVRESRAEAMYGVVRQEEHAQSVDLIREASVPLTQLPPDLELVMRATWRITGVDPNRFELAGGRQQVSEIVAEHGEEGLTDRPIELLIEREYPGPLPLERRSTLTPEIARHLVAEPFIQSDDEAIRHQSAQIVGDLEDSEAIARAINAWTFRELDKEGVISIPSAIDVLESRTGDCNEHATLATALLRAAGVPARIAAGLAFVEDGFYYHAWVEYWHDEWRTMDPTWGQFPADLGHLRLVAGGLQQQVNLVEVFRRVDVEWAQ